MPAGGGGDVTKRGAFVRDVLMWRYSGLYPPPFRLAFHTGSACAVGMTLNKPSNTMLPDCVSVFGSFLLERVSSVPSVPSVTHKHVLISLKLCQPKKMQCFTDQFPFGLTFVRNNFNLIEIK